MEIDENNITKASTTYDQKITYTMHSKMGLSNTDDSELCEGWLATVFIH